MYIRQQIGNNSSIGISARTDDPAMDWQGKGEIAVYSGFYTWRFDDGKQGKTTFTIDKKGNLHGHIQGPALTGNMWNADNRGRKRWINLARFDTEHASEAAFVLRSETRRAIHFMLNHAGLTAVQTCGDWIGGVEHGDHGALNGRGYVHQTGKLYGLLDSFQIYLFLLTDKHDDSSARTSSIPINDEYETFWRSGFGRSIYLAEAASSFNHGP